MLIWMLLRNLIMMMLMCELLIYYGYVLLYIWWLCYMFCMVVMSLLCISLRIVIFLWRLLMCLIWRVLRFYYDLMDLRRDCYFLYVCMIFLICLVFLYILRVRWREYWMCFIIGRGMIGLWIRCGIWEWKW